MGSTVVLGWIRRVRASPLIWLVLLADLAGMIFGWYYYVDVGQFDPSSRYYVHWSWWPLVSDSPNAVALFFVAVLWRMRGGRSRWLDAAAVVLNIYVGLWTTFLFVQYADRMGTWDWGGTNNILFITHMGMPLQTILLWPEMRDTWRALPVTTVIAAAAAFVFVDYWGPVIHPAPFLHPDDAALHAVSPVLMVVAVMVWLVLVSVGRRNHFWGDTKRTR